MNKVYVVNRGGHDFSDANRFGELVYLSEGKMDRFSITSLYRNFSSQIEESSINDYILITGLSSMSSIACSMFSYKHGVLNLLLFKNNKYVERKIILGELITNNEQKKE